jgi:hypothetical protein
MLALLSLPDTLPLWTSRQMVARRDGREEQHSIVQQPVARCAVCSLIQLTSRVSLWPFLSRQSLHHDVSVEQSLSLLHSKFNDTTLLSARVAAASKSWLQRKRDRDVQQIRDALHASAHGSTSVNEQQTAKRARVRAEQ